MPAHEAISLPHSDINDRIQNFSIIVKQPPHLVIIDFGFCWFTAFSYHSPVHHCLNWCTVLCKNPFFIITCLNYSTVIRNRHLLMRILSVSPEQPRQFQPTLQGEQADAHKMPYGRLPVEHLKPFHKLKQHVICFVYVRMAVLLSNNTHTRRPECLWLKHPI